MTKIAVATDDGKNVAGHAGRCRGFLVFEAEGQDIKVKRLIDNPNTRHWDALRTGQEHEHGHGDHATLTEALGGCKAVITGGMGPRLVRDFEARGIACLFTEERDADKAVGSYLAGQLASTNVSSCGCRH